MAPIAETAHVPALERLGYIEQTPPLVNALLRDQDVLSLSQAEFTNLLPIIDNKTPRLLSDQMTRTIDLTGFVPELVGRCDTPEEVQAELDTIASQVLYQLMKEPKGVRKEISDLLTMPASQNIHVSHKGLVWLHEQHGKTIRELADRRTPEAEAYRKRNLDAIAKTQETAVMYVPTYSTAPTYPTYFNADRCHVTGIKRYIHIPKLPAENEAILRKLTPVMFLRDTRYPDQDPMTPIGFMQQFRKAGDPLVRTIAERLVEQEQLKIYAEKISSQL